METAAALTHTAGEVHRYQPPAETRWLFRIIGTMLIVMSALFLYFFLFVFNPLIFIWLPIWFILLSLLAIAEGLIFWYNAQRMELIITSEGFSIHASGYTLSSPWSNVSRIGTRWGKEFLYLDRPAHVEGPMAWLAWLYRLNRFIRLDTWGQWWGTTPLARDLEAAIPSIIGAAKSR